MRRWIERVSAGLAVVAATVVLYGTASFPSAVKSFTTKSSGDTIQATHINDLQDEVTAIENNLINGPVNALVLPVPQVASSNANALDDFEEGVFTPTIVSSGGGTPT